MLDAHSDLFAAGSVDSDYEGFTGLISASHSFPYTAQVRFWSGAYDYMHMTAGTFGSADVTFKQLHYKAPSFKGQHYSVQRSNIGSIQTLAILHHLIVLLYFKHK